MAGTQNGGLGVFHSVHPQDGHSFQLHFLHPWDLPDEPTWFGLQDLSSTSESTKVGSYPSLPSFQVAK